ncbi:MAG: enoyl-CoA hydratase/isomerase family protein [bacterium]|nr:MAG: enoyl-CoA hydratase/isomerase family protein [bacterium]
MSAFTMNIVSSVAVVTFDAPGQKVNVLNLQTIEDLGEVLDRIEEMGTDIRGAVFLSAKERNFIAGADISLIEGLTDPDEAAAMARTGQKIFDRIAALPVPTVAAVHGSCLGGGLELALACDHRVASDAPETFLGFPETQLGIIPGFGGTQRLPRIVGPVEAMKMITTGSPVYPGKALRIGLVDEVTKREYLVDAAMAAVAGNLPAPMHRKGFAAKVQKLFEGNVLGRRFLLNKARKAVLASTRGHYPAPLAALDAIEYGLNHGLARGLERERSLFGEMAVTGISKNLIHVFYLRESFAKGDPSPAAGIRNVAVLGTGTMGRGIAALAVERGMNVRLIGRSTKSLGEAIKFLRQDVEDKHRKHRYTGVEADWIPTRLTVDTQVRGIARADVVIEAVAEEMDVKRSIFSSVAEAVSDTTAILTNTSSLSVTGMAGGVPNPERVAGFHFFNPVDRMPLVEVIRAGQTSPETVDRMAAFARRLGKVPVIVKDSPGFLVNRLLLPYLNEACFLLQEGADVQQVDRALLGFGMPMGAFLLLDQVGIDIVVHAGATMLEGFGDRMTPSPVLGALAEAGRLGKKSGKGFYAWDREGKHHTDPELPKLLDPYLAGKGNIGSDDIVRRLIYPMINEAALCLDEGVVESVQAVDAAVILGAGFPPFTGGLLRYADSIGVREITDVLNGLAEEIDHRFVPSSRLMGMAERGEVFYP